MNLSSMIRILFLIPASIFFMTASVTAQFSDALIPDETSILSPIFAQNTGNFVMDVSGTTYAVSVWDDPNGPFCAMEWKVGAATGYTLIDPAAAVVDPDVCLVKNTAGTVYALVAYYDFNSNLFKVRIFNWHVPSQQFMGINPEVLGPGQFDNSINIDANDVGDFAIVWDQPGQLIQMAFGQTPGASYPQFTFPGTTFDLLSGDMPDVSLYRSIATGSKPVHVVYRNIAGFLVVDSYQMSDLITGLLAPLQNFRSPAPDLVYRYPRIDSPKAGIGVDTDFTVVVEDSDNSGTWYIKGFNSHSCCLGFSNYIYNDGMTANSPYNLTDIPNTRPVVAYYDNGDGVMVGWNYNNSFGLLAAPGASISSHPIALSCDKQANINTGASFLNIPPSISFGTQIGHLSISGKNSTNGFYTYLNSGSSNIQYKLVPHVSNATNLKTSNSGNFYQWMEELNTGTTSENLVISMNVFDVLGKQVFYFNGELSEMMESWNGFLQSNQSGIYAVKAIVKDDDASFNGKVVTVR